MLTNNRIKGVVNTKTVEWNGINKIYCDITGLQPLSRVFVRKKIGMEEVSILFHAMGSLGEEAKKLLLNLSDFFFSPDMIFWNLNDDSVWFVFNPDSETDDMTEYAQFLLENADNSEPDAVRTIYEFYRVIREGNLDTEKLSDYFLYEEKKEHYEDLFDMPVKVDTEEKNEEFFPSMFIREEKKKSFISRLFSKKQAEVPEYEDDPIDLSAYQPVKEIRESRNSEETVLIDLGNHDMKYYLCGKNGEEIELPTDGIFIVGSKKAYVDIYIENASVSKIHAQFFQIGNEMMLSDLDSKNGTYVNGSKILDEVNLKPMDIIKFGTAEFTLRMK